MFHAIYQPEKINSFFSCLKMHAETRRPISRKPPVNLPTGLGVGSKVNKFEQSKEGGPQVNKFVQVRTGRHKVNKFEQVVSHGEPPHHLHLPEKY